MHSLCSRADLRNDALTLTRRLEFPPCHGNDAAPQESDALAVWKGSTPSRTHWLRLSLFLHGHRRRRWQSFGRSVNYNPWTGRGPDFVPAGNGTAHVFKTGCPSLANSSAGELVILHEAGP